MGYMKEKQSEIFICVRENVRLKQETENHMTTCFCRIRQERLTEKYGPQFAGDCGL